jgi:hypothetical protein
VSQSQINPDNHLGWTNRKTQQRQKAHGLEKNMLKDFFSRIKGPDLFITLIFMGLGLLVIALSIREYKEQSQINMEFSAFSSSSDPNISFHQLHSLFGPKDSSSAYIEIIGENNFLSPDLESGENYHESSSGHKVRFRVEHFEAVAPGDITTDDFDIVVRRNLFSPDREAWDPPLISEELQKETGPARKSPIGPREFKLHGVINRQNQKMALIYYSGLPGQSRNRLVNEGETIYLDRNQRDDAFKIIAIENESVTVSSGEDTFKVGLYSHERQHTASSEPYSISVVIGGTAEPVNALPGKRPLLSKSLSGQDMAPQELSAITPFSEPLQSVPDSDNEKTLTGGDAADPYHEAEQESTPRFLQRMKENATTEKKEHSVSIEDLERQVQEGTMRKVDTPFGPLFRPIR